MSSTLLEVGNLKKYFPVRRGFFSRSAPAVKAVDGVSFTIDRAETFGVVGESGCGKTTTGRAILRLIEPDSGEIRFDGIDLMGLSPAELRRRRRDMQIIFQDPYASLDPRMKVRAIIGEPFAIHKTLRRAARDHEVAELLKAVGLDAAAMDRYPHQFSGGQRQRIAIARALAMKPSLIVADEPVSALDVSVQSQIVQLLVELQKKFGVAYLFISHSIPLVEQLSRRMAVMYLGKLVEMGRSEQICRNPKHPYTRALISAVPVADPDIKRERIVLTGDVPTPFNPPSGCRFHTRCPVAEERCTLEDPELRMLEDGRSVACHLAS